MPHGKLIVIEGLDGSGKATQAALLTARLQKADKPVTQVSFPDYSSRSSELVKMYLGGEIGGLDSVNVFAASIFYAADRYISFETAWKSSYLAGHTIVADRYATSNAVHQTAKLPPGEWDDYLTWLEDLEYRRMELPRPDLVLYLDMPPEVSRKLILNRGQTSLDLHEGNFQYLKKCRETALYAAQRLGWSVIGCSDGDDPLPVEAVSLKIDKHLERIEL